MVYNLSEVAYAISIHHGLALELSTKLEAGAETLLRDKTAEAETEVWTEVLYLYATAYITIRVNRNLVVTNLQIVFSTFCDVLLQLVAVSCYLHQFVATH